MVGEGLAGMGRRQSRGCGSKRSFKLEKHRRRKFTRMEQALGSEEEYASEFRKRSLKQTREREKRFLRTLEYPGVQGAKSERGLYEFKEGTEFGPRVNEEREGENISTTLGWLPSGAVASSFRRNVLGPAQPSSSQTNELKTDRILMHSNYIYFV